MRPRLANVVLVLGSLAAGLAVLEIAAVVILGRPDIVGLLDGDNKLRGLLWRYYLDSDRAIVQFLPDCAKYDSLLGYQLRPGKCVFENREFSTEFHINDWGVRDDTAPAQAAIAVTGDSFAMGWGVEQHETFAELLERQLETPVLNAAISSYGTARELLLLRRLSLANAHSIVIAYNSNDFMENVTFLRSGGRLTTMANIEYEMVVQDHLSTVKYFPGKHIWSLLSLIASDFRIVPKTTLGQPSSLAEAQTFLDVLKQFPDVLSGRRLVIIGTEDYQRRQNNFISSVSFLLSYSDQLTFDADIKLVDMSDELTKDDYYVLDDHFTPQGHRKVARRLVTALRRDRAGGASKLRDFRHLTAGSLERGGRVETLKQDGLFYVFSGTVAPGLGEKSRPRVYAFVDGVIAGASIVPTAMAGDVQSPDFTLKIPISLFGRVPPALTFVVENGGNEALSLTVNPRVNSYLFALSEPDSFYRIRDGWIVDADENFLPVTDQAQGFVDHVILGDGNMAVDGWAVDIARHTGPEWIVVVLDDRVVAMTQPAIHRGDVAKVVDLRRSSLVGFSTTLPPEFHAASPDQFRFFAIMENGTAAEFGTKGLMTGTEQTAAVVATTPEAASSTLSDYHLSGDMVVAQDGHELEQTASGTGFVDDIHKTGNTHDIVGWAADPLAGVPSQRILVFADTALVAVATPMVDRPDVAAAFDNPAITRSGFSVRITLEDPSGGSIRVFGLFPGDSVAELAFSESARGP